MKIKLKKYAKLALRIFYMTFSVAFIVFVYKVSQIPTFLSDTDAALAVPCANMGSRDISLLEEANKEDAALAPQGASPFENKNSSLNKESAARISGIPIKQSMDQKLTPGTDGRVQGQSLADAVVVLTGGKNRIDCAFALALRYHIRNIFISGVNEKTSLEDILKNRNFDANITLGKRALNTIENALEILEWANEARVKKIFLVTSDYHIPRSLLALQKVCKGSLQITPIAVPSSNYNFIRNCFKEFIKIIFFDFFYAIYNIRTS